MTQRHSRDGISVTPEQLSKSLSNISHQYLSSQATNNAYLLLLRLILSPHRVAQIEKIMEKPCTLCFILIGKAFIKDQYHTQFGCVLAKYLRKILTFLWYKHCNITINTTTEAFYLLQPDKQIHGKSSDNCKTTKYNKLILMTFVTAHLVIRRLVDRPEITSSYTSFKHFLTHHFRCSIDRKLWADIPGELVEYTKFSLIPQFTDIHNPPFPFYSIQMSNYHVNRLKDEIDRKEALQAQLATVGFQSEEKIMPTNDELKRIQIAYNQALALIAIELGWTTETIQQTRKKFEIFWIKEE